ncbi:MAG: toll/interleukin-1 receptor domain-containing protein [Terricaulis sp.]
MPTVVIIHAAEDTLPARALAEKLRQARLTVVLEKPPGEELRDAVKGAPATIALWSPRAVEQRELTDEVAFARGKSKVFHACMQSAQPPEPFRGDKAVNLTGWRGEDEFPAWRELAKLVTDKAGVATLPPPAQRPASGFFQPGRVDEGSAAQAPRSQQRGQQQQQQPRQAPPRPAAQQTQPRAAAQQFQPRVASQRGSASAPKGEGGGRGMMMGVIGLVVVAALGGGGYFFWSQSQGAQTVSAAWEEVERNDVAALRAFLGGEPGAFRDEAQTALAELEERSYEAASDSDTLEALEAFLNEFPDSEHAIAARGRMAELESLPAAPTEAAPLPPAETPADPDLVPPWTTPDASGGPAPLTPPAETAPPEEPATAPTN